MAPKDEAQHDGGGGTDAGGGHGNGEETRNSGSGSDGNNDGVQNSEQLIAELRKCDSRLNIVHSVLQAASRSQDLPQVLEFSLEQLSQVLSVRSAAAFVIDRDTRRLRLAAQEDFPIELMRWIGRAPGGEDIFAEVLETGEGRVADLMADGGHLRAFFSSENPPALIVFPLKTATEVAGIVVLTVDSDQEIDDGTWTLLDSIGDELGVVVENVRLYEDLRQAYLSIIRALAAAIDARDAYTRGHSERVSAYAVAIGRRMGLDERDCRNLRDAGFLHDVGKIGTPDSVLLKQGVLSGEEMTTMKLHPGTSHKILEQTEIADDIKLMIRHHHEKFDGSGYPDGLAGDDISLGARILCVADAFEAMTSRRPYRKQLSVEQAVTEMQRCSGTQFDPQVVSVFVGLKNELDQAASALMNTGEFYEIGIDLGDKADGGRPTG